MAHLGRGCSKLARAALPVSRRGLAKAACDPCDNGADIPKASGKGRSGSAHQVAPYAAKSCEFDFKKHEVWPYDDSCGCTNPPPLAGCEDVGKPREVCCVSVRQYGCHCEEEADECEDEEPDSVPVNKECEIDFRKREVNPYDESCECREPPMATSCETLNQGQACCKSSLPFGCECDAYKQPSLDCAKQKAPPVQKKKKECDSKRSGPKCS